MVFSLQTVEKLSHFEVESLGIIVQRICNDNLGHFLSYSQEEEDKISYATKPEYRYDNDRRTKTTLARYLRRNYGDVLDMKEHLLMEFVRFTNSKLVELGEFQIVHGEDISEVYRLGIGGQSCMTGDSYGYTSLYSENPDKVKMVIYSKSARALLWKCDCGHTILDRVYPNDGNHVSIMQNWANEKGYLTRRGNSLPDDDGVAVSDFNTHTVTLPNTGVYPYMDTFHFGNTYNRILTLQNTADGNEMIFNRTDGEYSDIDSEVCQRCASVEPSNDMHFVEGDMWCSSCYENYATYCEYCHEYFRDGCVSSVGYSSICDSCFSDHATVCEDCYEAVMNNYIHSVRDRSVCDSCFDEEYTYCENCEEYAKEGEEFEGEYYCESCYNEIPECEKCTEKTNNTLCESCQEAHDLEETEATQVCLQLES